MKGLKSVLLFFALSFIWTWAFYFAIIIFGLNPYEGVGTALLICGGCSPTFVGLIMVLATYSKERKIEYFKRVYQAKRISPRWWLFIVLCFPAVLAVSIGIDLLSGGVAPEMTNLNAVIMNPVTFLPLILLSFMSGPFSEEFGWRGFALDPLLGRFGFTKASALLGTVWGLWHLPLYFMPQTWHGKMGFGFEGFWTFMLMSIGLSLLMSWVYVNTNRSILSALLMHLFSNFTAQLLAEVSPKVELLRGLLIFALGLCVAIRMIKVKRDSADNYIVKLNT